MDHFDLHNLTFIEYLITNGFEVCFATYMLKLWGKVNTSSVAMFHYLCTLALHSYHQCMSVMQLEWTKLGMGFSKDWKYAIVWPPDIGPLHVSRGHILFWPNPIKTIGD